jgi:hypothetical protein
MIIFSVIFSLFICDFNLSKTRKLGKKKGQLLLTHLELEKKNRMNLFYNFFEVNSSN